MRVFSFAQESTRYCNYSKGKFGRELTFIIPCWLNIKEGNGTVLTHSGEDFWQDSILDYKEECYLSGLQNSEAEYFNLLEYGWTPQQARAILPNALKTELIMTGFASDWEKFFKLRDDNAAHPQARELAAPLHKVFIENNWINER